MMTSCQNVKFAEPANASLSSVLDLQLTTDIRNLTFSWDEAEGVEAVFIYRNGKSIAELPAGQKSFFVFREKAGEDILYTFKTKKGDLVSEGVTKTVHIDYNGDAGISFLALENATPQEQMAKAWFEATFVAKGKGQVINAATLKGFTLDGKSSINIDRYSTLWVAIEGRSELPSEIDEEIVNALRLFSNGEGKIYLTSAACELLLPMMRLTEDYMPIAVDNSTIEGAGDWGLNCFMHKKLDYRTNAFFAGLVDNDGKVKLLSAGNRSNDNMLWAIGGATAMNSWNNAVYGYMYATVMSDTDGQYGGLAYLEKFGCPDGLVLNGTIVANTLPAYQWVSGNSYQNNIEKLTQNILDDIRIVK